MAEAVGAAPARAALAGNPSDGYGGAVLAVALDQLRAEAVAQRPSAQRPRPGNGPSVAPAPGPSVFPPSELVAAAVSRFDRELAPVSADTTIRWATSIPRGVGLGGSSALVIATLRALCGLSGVTLEPAQLAAFALAVETEELEIVAGLQDRVAEAYGGLTFMDFSPGGGYEELDPRLLPPLVVAWRSEAAQDSGLVHGSLRRRFERGDPILERAMSELAELAAAARGALLARDDEKFARSVDASFDVRQRILSLDPLHAEMIECARAAGAGANYTGSGGAITAVCRDERHRLRVGDAFKALGCGTLCL